MKKRTNFIYPAIIAVCFLYTGSAYMSQSFRLMEFYDERTVDIISSVLNYLFQGIGILIFSVGLIKYPKWFENRKLFIYLLIVGSLFMCLSQLSNNGLAVQLAGYVFNLLIGTYFGFYLTMLSKNISPKQSGLFFGTAYAIASVGTYILSLLRNGTFLVSKEITAIYLIMASFTIAVVFLADNLSDINARVTGSVQAGHGPDSVTPARAVSAGTETNKSAIPTDRSIGADVSERRSLNDLNIPRIIGTVVIMTVIFSLGAGLYYSFPVASSVNWNLIRAFYAIGLILAGFTMDKNRFIGEILAIGSLTYPLIMIALVSEGVTGTLALGTSYALRGFLTVYYVKVFTDIGWQNHKLLFLASIGLMTSRITESLISLIIMTVPVSETMQLIIAAVCFIPLLILFVILQSKKNSTESMSDSRLFALYCEKYDLTSRETQILTCLIQGLSDSEIAEKLFISKNTVRFHISNLLKKTETTSRVDVVRAIKKMS